MPPDGQGANGEIPGTTSWCYFEDGKRENMWMCQIAEKKSYDIIKIHKVLTHKEDIYPSRKWECKKVPSCIGQKDKFVYHTFDRNLVKEFRKFDNWYTNEIEEHTSQTWNHTNANREHHIQWLNFFRYIFGRWNQCEKRIMENILYGKEKGKLYNKLYDPRWEDKYMGLREWAYQGKPIPKTHPDEPLPNFLTQDPQPGNKNVVGEDDAKNDVEDKKQEESDEEQSDEGEYAHGETEDENQDEEKKTEEEKQEADLDTLFDSRDDNNDDKRDRDPDGAAGNAGGNTGNSSNNEGQSGAGNGNCDKQETKRSDGKKNDGNEDGRKKARTMEPPPENSELFPSSEDSVRRDTENKSGIPHLPANPRRSRSRARTSSNDESSFPEKMIGIHVASEKLCQKITEFQKSQDDPSTQQEKRETMLKEIGKWAKSVDGDLKFLGDKIEHQDEIPIMENLLKVYKKLGPDSLLNNRLFAGVPKLNKNATEEELQKWFEKVLNVATQNKEGWNKLFAELRELMRQQKKSRKAKRKYKVLKQQQRNGPTKPKRDRRCAEEESTKKRMREMAGTSSTLCQMEILKTPEDTTMNDSICPSVSRINTSATRLRRKAVEVSPEDED